MKAIKLKHRGAKCSWCAEIATKRGFRKKACPSHTNLLRLEEDQDDGYQSEGERQAMNMFGI